MKITVFWDIVLCSLVEGNRRFGGANSLHHMKIFQNVVFFILAAVTEILQ
jgi:hypothetical protein